MDEFIENRLKKCKDFFEPLKRMNLKTMADMSKTVTLTSAKN